MWASVNNSPVSGPRPCPASPSERPRAWTLNGGENMPLLKPSKPVCPSLCGNAPCCKTKRRAWICGLNVFIIGVVLGLVFSVRFWRKERALPSQLANNAECQRMGFDDDFLLSQRHTLTVDNKPSSFLPVFSTHDLSSKPDRAAEGALIWLHGLSGDANSYFCTGLAALRASGARNVVGIAPWFGNEPISGDVWDLSSAKRRSIFWASPHWLTGGDDTEGLSNAFQILDQLVLHLLNPTLFPAMKLITIAGFSAGAQLLSRWAFFSRVPRSAAVRCIVGDPGTLLYLNSLRPAAECSPLSDSGPSHSCAAFLPADPLQCPAADAYKYGVNLTAVSHNSYLLPFRDPSAVATAIRDYAYKDIRYLFGQGDVCNCNAQNFNNSGGCLHEHVSCAPNRFGGPGCCDSYPDSEETNAVDTECAGMLQGSNRLQRGLNYMSYLASNASGIAFVPQFAVFDGEHDMRSYYHDSHFKAWAYLNPHR